MCAVPLLACIALKKLRCASVCSSPRARDMKSLAGLLGGWPKKKNKVVPDAPLMRVTVEAFPQIDAIGYDCKLKYPVTVQVRPPKASGTPPTPVDFVAVLDTSAGMTKEMLQHLKEAMLGVVDAHLTGPEDRFCMVSWNSESEGTDEAKLTPMSRDGLEAKFSKLVGAGKSDIPGALQQAVKVIEKAEKRDSNSFIVLFSAGGHADSSSIKEPTVDCEFPVYTIGLPNHDPRLMYKTAEATGGTYNFVDRDMEKLGSLVGKLIQREKSTIWTNIEIPFCIHGGVRRVSEIVCPGSRKQHVTDKANSSNGVQQHVVKISRLYAGLDINFTVYLDVRQVENQKFDEKLTIRRRTTETLAMTVGATYHEGRGIIQPAVDKPVDVFIKRTRDASDAAAADANPHPEVKRLGLKRRISGYLEKDSKPTAAGLEALLSEFLRSEGGCDLASKWKLEEDIREMQKGISDANTFRMQGLPYMLSWLSAHNWQRATAKGSPFIPDDFLPTSTPSFIRPNSNRLLLLPTQHTAMCRAALLLQHLPAAACSAVSAAALAILLLAVLLFGFHTAGMPALQLVVMGYGTLLTAMNRAIQQYLYSAITYSVILGAFSTFVTNNEHRADQEKEKDEDTKIFKQAPLLSERANNTAAYPNACGGRAGGMSTVQISETRVAIGLAVAITY